MLALSGCTARGRGPRGACALCDTCCRCAPRNAYPRTSVIHPRSMTVFIAAIAALCFATAQVEAATCTAGQKTDSNGVCVICPAGYYCPGTDGIALPCDSTMAPPGSYCPEGLDAEPTATYVAPQCPAGYYCAGSNIPPNSCDHTSFIGFIGAKDSSACQLCETAPGFYCPSFTFGTDPKTGSPYGPAGA